MPGEENGEEKERRRHQPTTLMERDAADSQERSEREHERHGEEPGVQAEQKAGFGRARYCRRAGELRDRVAQDQSPFPFPAS